MTRRTKIAHKVRYSLGICIIHHLAKAPYRSMYTSRLSSLREPGSPRGSSIPLLLIRGRRLLLLVRS